MQFKIKYKFLKYDERGTCLGTYVEIASEEGVVMPALLDEKAVKLPDVELIEHVKDDVYRKVYVNRAEKERFEQIEQALEVLKAENKKQIDLAVADMTKLITEIIASAGGEGEHEESVE
ncbi:DUF1366 domain-containing protein [Aerococcaceae bacterium NML210727]|nr:DUF1366 domain-containing protein [Aerococcaceae bacterium NML210727]MCW6655091.1 DUF1366 domain-containing protein [Aerococcaceae bacterium NML201296]